MKDQDIICNLLSVKSTEVNNALEAMFKYLSRISYSIVLRNSGNEEDARDVLIEGIMSFYDNVKLKKSIKIENNLIVNKNGYIVKISSYMYTVFRNNWFNKLRSREDTSIDINELNIESENFDDIFKEKSEFDRKHDLIMETIMNMGEVCRQILTLFWVDRKRYSEISLLMNHESSDVSKSTKSRCQKKLKSIMNNE